MRKGGGVLKTEGKLPKNKPTKTCHVLDTGSGMKRGFLHISSKETPGITPEALSTPLS